MLRGPGECQKRTCFFMGRLCCHCHFISHNFPLFWKTLTAYPLACPHASQHPSKLELSRKQRIKPVSPRRVWLGCMLWVHSVPVTGCNRHEWSWMQFVKYVWGPWLGMQVVGDGGSRRHGVIWIDMVCWGDWRIGCRARQGEVCRCISGWNCIWAATLGGWKLARCDEVVWGEK